MDFLVSSVAFFGMSVTIDGHQLGPSVPVGLSVDFGGFFGFVGGFRWIFWFRRWLFWQYDGCRCWCLSVLIGGFRWISWFCRCFFDASVKSVGGHIWLSSCQYPIV